MSDLGTWLVALHAVGASVWLGAWVCIVVFGVGAVSAPTGESVQRFFAVMRRLGPTVIGPATLLVLASGIILVILHPRVAWTDPWIVIGMVIYVLVTLLGVLVLGRHSRRIKVALETDDLDLAVVTTRSWLVGAAALTGLLLLATIDMVVRP
jgi:uncharacterized membrane protein